ncbi:MAG: HEAT repeat domain-containing protein [Deltaproteobacteria bacterium]|nr:HEAT repeat domain-containing protein [Deltaproteobacteria bacterium]
MRCTFACMAVTVLVLGCGPRGRVITLSPLDNLVVVENIEKLHGSDSKVVIQAAKDLDDYSDPVIAQALVDQLAHPDADVRVQIVESLARIGEAAVEPLVARLESPGSAALKGAVLALDLIGDERAVEPLIELLRKNIIASIHIFNALKSIGEPSIEPLVALLDDVDPNVRLAGARALGHLGSEQACVPLVGLLGEGVESTAMLELIISMGQKPVPALIGALGSSDVTVRELAAIALERITITHWHPDLPAALVKVLDDESTTVRLHAAIALGRTREKEAVPPLIGLLKDEDARVCKAAAASLAQLEDPAALPRLIDYLVSLKNDPWFGAVPAIKTLLAHAHEEQEAEVALALTKLTGHDDVRLRAAAADLMGELPTEDSLDHLLELMRSIDDLVRQYARPAIGKVVRALAEKGEVESILTDMSHDDSYAVREICVGLMAELKGEKAVEPLKKFLSDKDYRVVSKAALLLHGLGDGSGVAPLVKMLKSDQESAVMQAWDALDRMGELNTEKILLAGTKAKKPFMRASAVTLLGKKKEPKHIPAIAKLLSDKELLVAEAAAWSLGHMGKPAAIKPLVKALKSASGPHDAAAKALVTIGPASIKRVIGALTSKNRATLVHAAHVLEKIGGWESVGPLSKLIKGKDQHVRDAARRALKAITCTDLGEDHAKWKKWLDEGNLSGKGCVSDKAKSIEKLM